LTRPWQALASLGIAFVSFKDHVVFERSEILTQNNQPYGVFTPYKNNWLKKVTPADLKEKTVKPAAGQLACIPATLHKTMPSLKDMGFESVDLQALHIQAGSTGADVLVKVSIFSLFLDLFISSSGPVFFERMQTFGHRRLWVGSNRLPCNAAGFSSVML
jgi:hypothetical protein